MIEMCSSLIFSLLVLASFVLQQTHAQPFGSFSLRPVQNDPPSTEVIIARLHFGTNGNTRHTGWSHNYPGSDREINGFLERKTLIDSDEFSYRIVELGSNEVFDYPFAHVSEPGEMELTEQEVTNLREYTLRGGTIIMDDFDGDWQSGQMESQVRRAFPLRPLVPIDADHILFSAHEQLENLQAMSQYVPGNDIAYYGLFTDEGRLAILVGHNNDLANFWDWYSDGSMPLKPSTDAFRLGTNAVIYSMTH
jgi:hypothetical protein